MQRWFQILLSWNSSTKTVVYLCWSSARINGNASPVRALSQYPKRRLSVRSRKVPKPRDLHLGLSDRSEIWQALRQQCCRCACHISKRYGNLKYQSRGFGTLRDLTKSRLFGYWDGAQLLKRSRLLTAYFAFSRLFWNLVRSTTVTLRWSVQNIYTLVYIYIYI